MRRAATSLKYQDVRDEIARAIRNGEYALGERLPAERDLAIKFGVSHMTARRAVTELVELDILERMGGSGSYVRSLSQHRLSTITVNLICQAYESSLAKSFLRIAGKEASRRGWLTRTHRLQLGHEPSVARILDEDACALVMVQEASLCAPLIRSMQGSKGRTVLIGNRMDKQQIPSVLADDSFAIHMAMAHLRELGHRRIAIVSDHPNEAIDRVQITAWENVLKDTLSEIELKQYVIAVNSPNYECPGPFTYNAVSNFLKGIGKDATALLCLNDELALASIAACRDAGRAVPEAVSVICSGDSMMMAYSHPAVTCIDVNLDEHISSAMQVLEKATSGTLTDEDYLTVIQPRLVIRDSVSRTIT